MLPSGYGALDILIVDDIANTRHILRAILRHMGFTRVSEAAGVAEALRRVREAPPDLIFTDWDMPGASGLDLIRIVRSHPDSPDPTLPVILLTAHGDRQFVKAGRAAGATDFLVKPLAPARIRERILDVVGRPRGFVLAPGYRGPDRRRTDRPVAHDRRSRAAPDGGVLLLPPDGLLMAKVTGDEAAVTRALQVRAAAIRALTAPPAPLAAVPPASALSDATFDLDRLAGEALGAIDRCAETLARMAAPLDLFRRSMQGRLPASAERVVASMQRLIADPAGAAETPGLIGLHLMAIRAMLRADRDPSAERTAAELADQIDVLVRHRQR